MLKHITSYISLRFIGLGMVRASLASLTLFLPYIDWQGGRKGSSINDLCQHQNSGCTPAYSALLAMEDQVMKSVFRSYSFVRKARADERECLKEMFL